MGLPFRRPRGKQILTKTCCFLRLRFHSCLLDVEESFLVSLDPSRGASGGTTMLSTKARLDPACESSNGTSCLRPWAARTTGSCDARCKLWSGERGDGVFLRSSFA